MFNKNSPEAGGGFIKEIIIILIIPTIFLLYAIFTIGDYGINWDEPYHFRRGQAFLYYFLTGQKTYEDIPRYPPLKGTSDDPSFRDSQKHFEEVQKNPSLSDPDFRRSYYQDEDWNGEYHIDMEDPYGHPALNGILAALSNKIFFQKLGILGDLESYHLFAILMSSLLVFAIAVFMWKEFGVIESVVSSLALTTYPLFLGEQHFNIKDPVVTAFYTFTLLSLYKAVTKKSAWWLLIASITFAAGLSVKFNIIFIVFPLVIWTIYYFNKSREKFRFSKKFIITALIAPLLVTGIFILFSPTIWKNPVWGLGRVVDFYLKEGYSLSQPSKYYYLGFINSYPLIWILYTTPIPSLVLFASLLLYPKQLLKKKAFPILLLLSIAVSIARITFFGALSYGGVRLIMEYIPPFAILSGIAAGTISKSIKKPAAIFILIILIAYAPVVLKLINIHPNENVFFNVLAGGLDGARQKQLSSWGNSNGNAYYPALIWLNENAETDAKLTLPVGSLSNIPRFKLRKDISLSWDYWSGPLNNGEYVIELTYDYPPMQYYALAYLNKALQPVYEVKVDEVAVAKVWKNSQEYVLPEYKNEEVIPAKINIDKDSKFVQLTIPEVEKIMKIELTQPTRGCNPISTGHVDTSIDEKDWTKEAEDIARDQLKHFRIRQLEQEFTFYFVAREAKYIRFHPQNPDACLLQSSQALVTILTDP